MRQPPSTTLTALRAALVVLLALSAFVCLAQVWEHFQRIGTLGDHCDFPEDCVSRYLPGVYADLGRWWLVGAALAWLVIVAAAIANVSRSSLLRVGVAGAVASLWFFATPLWYARDDVGFMVGHQPVGIDLTFGFALLLLVGAAVLYSSEAIRLMRRPHLQTGTTLASQSSSSLETRPG